MDVVISGPQGSGKSTAAKAAVEAFKARKGKNNAVVMELDGVPLGGLTVDTIAEALAESTPDVVVFDGCITSAHILYSVASAVRQYRQATGREVLALYVEQGGALDLTPKS